MAATRLNPRTPILVGGGQVNERDGGREPVDLIAEAARRAADEAGGRRLLAQVESIRLVRMLSWRYRNAAALVGERLGVPVQHTGYTGDGGSNPQALVNAAAEDIAAGRHDAVLIGGAEAWRSRMRLRAEAQRPDWTRQDESVPPPELLIPDVPMVFENQKRTGLDRPAYVYPLFEQALRIAAGRSLDDQRSMIGDLWARFSDVAAGNPHAWTQRSYSAAEIITPSPGNRWVSWPYTKLLNSNNSVEQGAAVLLCSVEMAERAGVPRDNWVFLQAGTEAHDSYDIGARGDLHRSPAILEAGAELLRLGGTGIGDIEHVDLYSCFPSAVQVAAMELGLDIQDHARPLTVTGGLTFAGGPWNNYSTHAIATMATLLRHDPGSAGLVTANGGYLTKHAIGLYSTRPPAEAFRRVDVQHRVDAHATRRSLVQYEGTASVEAWTVVFDRAGDPERGLASVLTADGARAFAATTEAGSITTMLTEDMHNAKVSVSQDGSFAFCELAPPGLSFLRRSASVGGQHMDRREFFIDGGWVAPRDGTVIDVIEAATGEPMATAPLAGPADIDAAVRSARRALSGPWAAIGQQQRADLLDRFGEELKARGRETSVTVSRENGMPITMSKSVNGFGPAYLVWYYARLLRRLELEQLRPSTSGGRTVVRQEPAGVVAAITPWNYPQVLAAMKVAPALAAGCTVVLKPPPETAVDAFVYAEAAEAAGLPPGVLNVVPGDRDAGARLAGHPAVNKVAFTGSTTAGRAIGEVGGRLLRPVTLELGGKSASLVTHDADLDLFASKLLEVSLPNNGQTCHASTRILAPRSRYGEVVDAVTETVRALAVGDPLDKATQVGPLVSAAQRARVLDYVAVGRASGARLTAGGAIPAGRDDGWFVEPTVFADVDNRDRIAREEIFGPVLAVLPYDTIDQAIEMANDSDYGLGGVVWTADEQRGIEIARRIQTGSIGVNHYDLDIDAPFGGVKASGIGRELGPEGLRPYLIYKSIYLAAEGSRKTAAVRG